MLYTDKIIKGVVVSEKSNALSSGLNQYTFEIYPDANRIEVGKAIESIYNVTVTKVNIVRRAGKKKVSRIAKGKIGTTRAKKRAIVTLKSGDKIELI